MAKGYLVATFAEPEALVRAVANVRQHGFKIYAVYSPFPVHGLDEAMGLRRSRLGLVAFAAGLAGLASAVALQYYCAVVDWPLNVGGKPVNSTLAFVPISFELTVLFAGVITAKAFLFRSRLFPGAAARMPAPRVTDDTFAIALKWRATVFDTGEVRRLLHDSGALDVRQMAGDL